MKQEKKDLIFKLDGEKISSSAFKNAVENFFGIVDKVSAQLIEKKHALRWIVSVEKGCICLGLHPDVSPDEQFRASELIETIETGINDVSQKDERPPYFSNEILSNLKALTELPKKEKTGIKGIYVTSNGNKMEIGSAIQNNIDSILKIQREEFGSFEGTLKIISALGGLHVQIYEFVHDHPVKCLMNEEIIKKALGAFNKRVYVFGLIRYSKGGFPKDIRVYDLRILRDEGSLPTANDVLGILKDIN
jgi:hypothetical protein